MGTDSNVVQHTKAFSMEVQQVLSGVLSGHGSASALSCCH